MINCDSTLFTIDNQISIIHEEGIPRTTLDLSLGNSSSFKGNDNLSF